MPTQDEPGTQKEEVTQKLDRIQEDVMSARSSDGRPPPTKLRQREWRWFGIGGGLVLAALLVWMVVSRASMGSVLAGVGYAVLLLAAASPVLGAGLLRGQEERAAHKIVHGTAEGEGSMGPEKKQRDLHDTERDVGDGSGVEGEPVPVTVTAAQMEFHEPATGAAVQTHSTADVDAVDPAMAQRGG